MKPQSKPRDTAAALTLLLIDDDGFIPEEIPPDVASCIDVLLPKPVSMDTFNELIDGACAICETMSSIRELGLALAVGD